MKGEFQRTWINGHWRINLPKHRADRPSWPWWEATRLAAMNHFIADLDSPVVYDIGAEEGDFPALFAIWGAQVVLFEPNPKVWPNIRAIFESNDMKPLEWFVGLASDKTTNFKITEENNGWPECAYGEVIGDHGFINLAEAGDTPQVCIDDYMGPTPDVITIDTEGSELRVLAGAEETLRKHKPIVFVSIHPQFMEDMYGDKKEGLLKFMEELGYHDTFLTADHEEHWLFHPERSFH